MKSEQPTAVAYEKELVTATDAALAALIDGNDDTREIVMDDYPEYWIG